MITPITSKVIKRVPYVGPVIQGVGIAIDAKEIIESSTPKLLQADSLKHVHPLKF